MLLKVGKRKIEESKISLLKMSYKPEDTLLWAIPMVCDAANLNMLNIEKYKRFKKVKALKDLSREFLASEEWNYVYKNL